jgi:protein-disulfide isomerase
MGKREEQKKRKEAKQAAAQQRQKTQQVIQKFGLYIIAPLLAIFVVYTLLSQGPTYSPVEIADNDHIRGNPSTPVSIVVYADFQCPACATEHQTMSQLFPGISNQAHLVFRHFPITSTHPHAWTASLYAEAAGRQGAFWPMHDYLFANQPIWSGLTEVEDEFNSYALELNLDLERLQADLENPEVIAKVRSDQRGGNAAGVRSTPAVFINGRLLASPSRTRILQVVSEEAEATGAE